VNHWLSKPFQVSTCGGNVLVAVPIRLVSKYRDWLESEGVDRWEEYPDDRPNFVLFAHINKI